MASRISELVIDCRDPQRLAEFWCAVLGFTVLDVEHGAIEIGPPDGFGGPQPTSARPARSRGTASPTRKATSSVC
jgi:hypothetical protein